MAIIKPSYPLPYPLNIIKHRLQNKKSYYAIKDQLSEPEQKLINQINHDTRQYNRNNVTRTEAYFRFYQQFPEVEWSFLAHMVSRNAGWNMTDLKGSLLSKLLTKEQQQYFFHFLERNNWLIFQDAYPQLRLYEASIRLSKNMFYMLPLFGVSYFMKVIWDYFYENRQRSLITNALIINEQNYIENRVINNPQYARTNMEALEFIVQQMMQMNQIMFPYKKEHKVQLVGLNVHRFESLPNRIDIGKQLYQVLFHPKYYAAIYQFAVKTPHSGSRKDYWPSVFRESCHDPLIRIERETPAAWRLKPLFSPKLSDVWTDIQHPNSEKEDWYTDWHTVYLLDQMNPPKNPDILPAYHQTLAKLQLAVKIKEWIGK
ncbi:DUF2515 domain-containing protein [Gracilibacillus caseinilyticus]|uniref:DUF2515 domain-containing protein n=1 Tax=Gracilibacillus caseinilyticus TaxID=2932256 RepID=A0ABY4EU38_9BACI|nr:DUF2515 family protein [Gracilibacillus caseinilyticus]UOQ47382.1 DUF2515 domain-containing protein [Gracilibacillus caseinilyticus]